MTSPHFSRPSPVPVPLGALEQRVIEVLWDHGALTVREVIAAFESDHAYTTITTVLSNLERKRMVTSRRAGRYVRHRPTRSRSEHVAELMEHALSTSHDRTASILHFLGTMRQLTLHEAKLAELRAALAAGELDLVVGPAVGTVPLHEQSIIDSEPLVLVDAGREAEVRVELTDLADKQLILLPDTCGLTTHSLLRDHGLQVTAYRGEASSYRVLEEWSRLGLGAALLPESKLAEPHAPHRTVYETDGTTVEVYYGAVWDPTSSMAAIMRDLADRLHRSAR